MLMVMFQKILTRRVYYWPEIPFRSITLIPFAGFLPANGQVRFLRAPSGPGVRWDGGIEAGNEISLFYDSLLGKLIVWGETRDRAIRRMRRALDEMVIVGLPTSIPFHRRVMEEPGFLAGDYDIEYVDRIGNDLLSAALDDDELKGIAVAAALAEHEKRNASYIAPERQALHSDSAWLLAARRNGLR